MTSRRTTCENRFAVDYEKRIDFERLRHDRKEKVREEMKKAGVGAILTFDPDNIRYITGFYITTPMRSVEGQCVFFPVNGEPYLVIADMPERHLPRMPWMDDRIIPLLGFYKPTAVDSNDPVLMNYVNKFGGLMAEHGLTNMPLGLDGTVLQMLFAQAFERKGIKCIHGKPIMDYARMIKTSDEINIIRIACANAEKAHAAVADAIRPGIKECELVAIGIKALYDEGCDHVEDLVCMSGPNTNPYGLTFTDRMIRPGDLVYVDVDGNSFLGYRTCIYRTFCCGKATQEQKETYYECRDMLYSAITKIKAGVTDHEIMASWPDSPSYWGYKTWGEVAPLATGHGIGLTLHDRPFLSCVNRAIGTPPTTLQAGMVIALETWTGKKGGDHGVRLEEMILVKEDGYEVLSKFPVNELIECWIPYN
jgi:Xaa-Pro aminopeptidase